MRPNPGTVTHVKRVPPGASPSSRRHRQGLGEIGLREGGGGG